MTIGGQFLGWQTVQTSGDVINTLGSTCLVMSKTNVVGIVGPAFSTEAHVIVPFAERVGIPVISYAATDPDLTDRKAYPGFYRTVPSDNAAALAIAQLFNQFNWTSCIVIYQNDVFGSGGVNAIIQRFNEHGVRLVKSIIFDIATLSIRGNLKVDLKSSPTRIVILWAQSTYATRILQSALEHDVLGPHFTWILSSTVPLNSLNRTFHKKFIGMLTIQPTVGDILSASINRTLLNAACDIWKQNEPESFPGSTTVDNYALFAFDATWSLIRSLERLCSRNMDDPSSCISILNSSFCFDTRILDSKSFFDAIIDTEFLGVSGPVQFSVNVTDRINGTYYLAQNIQTSSNELDYVPVLEWVDADGWKPLSRPNAIVWPGNSFVPPFDRARLSGVSLRIGVTESIPFTIVTNVTDDYGQIKRKFKGYVPDLINLLQNKMGFNYEIILAPSNQTYSGLIEAVANGIYDMVVGDVTITAQRRQSVRFSNSIFDNSLRIIVPKKPVDSVNLFAYFEPFPFNLWIILLFTIIYASVLLCLLERPENPVLRNRSFISSVAMSWWYSFGTILGYGASFPITTAAGRLLTAGLYLLSLVFVATYTANLASDLTISKSKSIISGVDDIKNGKIPFSRFGIRLGTVGEEYYLREISEGNRNFYPLNSRQHMYESLLNGLIDASFMDSGTAEYITNNIYCNLTLVGADFDKSALGIVVPNQWLYGQELDVNILSLRESGALNNLRRKWFQLTSCPHTSDTPASMAMGTMSGLFVTFAVISLLSLLLLAWTKRCTIKDYLFKQKDRIFPLFTNYSTALGRTRENSKRSQHSEIALSDRVYF